MFDSSKISEKNLKILMTIKYYLCISILYYPQLNCNRMVYPSIYQICTIFKKLQIRRRYLISYKCVLVQHQQ